MTGADEGARATSEMYIISLACMWVMSVSLREPVSMQDYEGILGVMREAWSMEESEVVPVHVLKAVNENGGFLRVAEVDGRIVGFVLALIGYCEEHGYYLYSHMLGVLPAYRGTGVALRLKLLQREWALSRGYDLVTWTFDPHQGRNARFNFGKLGVIARKFYENYYGELRDELNRGLPTDRFLVEWWVNSERVKRRIIGIDAPPSFREIESKAFFPVETVREGGFRKAARVKLAEEELIALEFPYDITALRDADLDAAWRWKVLFREAVKFYLQHGYIVCEHVSSSEDSERRNFYLLVRAELHDVLEGNYPWR